MASRGRAHNRLVIVEGCVDDGRHAGELAEFADQPPVSRIGFAIDGLQAAGAVDVGGGGQRVTFFLAQRDKQKS